MLRIAVNAFGLPSNLAGIGFYMQELYRALADLPGVGSVTVFTNSAAARRLDLSHPRISVRGFDVEALAARVAWSQFVFPFLARGFDVAHSVGNVASLLRRGPQVVTVHDLCHKVLPQRFGLSKRGYLSAGFALSTAFSRSRFACVSASTERDLIRYYPAARGRTMFVHSASKFEPSTVAGERSGLLFVGTLEPGKNLVRAFEALRLLKQRGLSPELRIAGAKGWKQSGLPALARSLGIADQVRFLGSVDEASLRRLYRESEALLFPSRYEGFGLPTLEAQSQGCLVVAADNSCMREVGGEGAAYFRDDDAEDFARVTEVLLRDAAARERLRSLGLENVRRFSWEKTASAMLAEFQAAARSGASGT
jgi:glycosyltransferase involved in cell wall biosynthesis